MQQIAKPKGHPKGLYVLFATEMWERFNFYGMRSILILFMTSALLFEKAFASNLYGSYLSLIYLTPLLGGFIADRFWGNRRCIITGGLVMAAGEGLLFCCGSMYQAGGPPSPLALLLFFSGLGLMITGNGFFKPNISSLVGQLYPANDIRKDSAYTIFYMGINTGGMLGPFICGLVGEREGHPEYFKWAFLVGGIGMLISVVVQLLFQRKYVRDSEGRQLGTIPANTPKMLLSPIVTVVGLAVLASCFIGLLYLDSQYNFLFYLLTLCIVVIPTIIFLDKTLSKIERDRVVVVFVICFFVIFFWAAFEQAGASLTFFAAEQTDRHIGQSEIPASWFQSLNSTFVVLFAPFFAWLWLVLGKKQPSSIRKTAFGLFMLGMGYLWIAQGVNNIAPGIKVSMIWLTGMYALHTMGELCLSPIGLSLFNKLSPIKYSSLLMGVWFTANAFGNKLAGVLSAVYPPGAAEISKAKENGIDLAAILETKTPPPPNVVTKLKALEIPYEYKTFLGYHINNLYDFFMLFLVMAVVAAAILFLFSKKLRKMMHEDIMPAPLPN